jgi:DNA repair protein RadD
MIPRPYQAEALDALHNHICEKDTNPCIVIPTGGGKSALIAWTIMRWKETCPWFRCIILAHRKELIAQNASELSALCGGIDIGVYSAALKRRDSEHDILFASIDSVYKKSGEFRPFDVIMVDEAHRIPPSGDGKYRTFIDGCRRFNKDMRVIGWTATPFRMGCGDICHKDHYLHEVCYEASVVDLIKAGYLCNLRSKIGTTQPNLQGVRRNSGGDYVISSLSEATNDESLISEAVSEAVRIINAEDRKHAIFFCVNIEHCIAVSRELAKNGIYAPYVTSKIKQSDRDVISDDFRHGRLRAICNVNVFTEGFNAPNVDCIVLLRPTLSPGLFSQMVGRGLRVCNDKDMCLVLDFAGCIEEHGPVDLLGGQPVVMAVCAKCRESFSRAVKVCPACGWEIPKQEIERLAGAEKAKRRMHGTKSSERSILSNQPEVHAVTSVFVHRHVKNDSPDSLRIQYQCGLRTFREWVCLDHEGYAGRKAQLWWEQRFGKQPKKVSVNDAMEGILTASTINDWTKTITVVKKGRYHEIIGYNEEVKPEKANEQLS